jgi:lipid-binding SYLF domain-containing protein
MRVKTLIALYCLYFAPATLAAELTTQERLVGKAETAMQSFLTAPDSEWLKDQLQDVLAVMIIPRMIKAGFVFGASGGDAVMIAKHAKTKTWSKPAFYKVGSFGVGLQAGVQKSTVLVLVRTEAGLQSMLRSSGKLGAGGSIAVGPIGGSSTTQLPTDMVSFTRTKGLFAGVSLDGVSIGVDIEANEAYYRKGVTARDLLINQSVKRSNSDKLARALSAALK